MAPLLGEKVSASTVSRIAKQLDRAVAALPLVFPRVPIQRCWAHKTRNVLNKVRKVDQQGVQADPHQISHAKNMNAVKGAMSAFHCQWKTRYPEASPSLARDSEALQAFFRSDEPKIWSRIGTTNAIERRFREVRGRTRPMGVFSDFTSMERSLYALFTYENTKQGTGAPIPLTQNP